MKKTFSLQIEGKHPDRVLDAVKHELHKYVKRERRKALPAGVDYWDFDCTLGADADSAEAVHVKALSARLDELAQGGAQQVYVAIAARAGVRQFQARPDAGDAPADAEDD
ncbi:DUF6172 family protein [Macromonas nakdongensis]|uniref:DUF6172 family protein n=1 Tax=Macromonas nakdongensis TaxID=1843082 RepID=UPI000C3358FC|nr:DUF6172 family protein [Macromonas nakdongensis]